MGSPQRLVRWYDLLLCKLKFPTEHFCHSNAHKDCLAERLPAESKFHTMMISIPYLLFVIFFTQSIFLENKIYSEKRQFFALNL